mgnify:FL=1
MDKKRLLITRFSAMGDVAMCVPVVWSLAKNYPETEIIFLSRKNFEPMFKQCPKNVKFIGIDLKKDYKGISGLNKLFNEIKALNIDCYADFHDVLRTKFLRLRTTLTGITTKKIDKGRRQKKLLTKKGANNFTQLPTTFERYQKVLENLGFKFSIDFKSIFTSTVELPQKIITLCGEKQDFKWVGIAPFAAHKGKILPLEKTEKLLEKLSSKNNIKTFLFGAGEKEKVILENWQEKYTNVISTAGKLGGLENELMLISKLDCMVSMDSANMHLASLTATRTVSIWGATHLKAGFLGFNQNESDAVQINLPCRPCSIYGNKECKLDQKYRCLEEINPDDILIKVLNIIN